MREIQAETCPLFQLLWVRRWAQIQIPPWRLGWNIANKFE
jgi:hypothetical protein